MKQIASEKRTMELTSMHWNSLGSKPITVANVDTIEGRASTPVYVKAEELPNNY